MPGTWLLLWLNLYPAALLTGAVTGLAAYWIAHPRPSARCGGVLEEAWRAYAAVPALAGFMLGAQVHIWLAFSWRAPVAFARHGTMLGLTLLALAAAPLVVAACNCLTTNRRAWLTALALATVGGGLVLLDGRARARAWDDLAERARTDSVAREHVAVLKGLRYVPASEARSALDRAEGAVGDLINLAEAGRSGAIDVDRDLRGYLATRIAALADERHGDSAPRAVWWLTGDPELVARAYAVTHPAAAIPPAGGIAAAEAVVVAARALGGSPELMADLISALDVYVGRTPLAPATVAALRGVAAGPEPARAMAVRVLFRNGSRESLRAVLPLFLNRSDPAWGLLASDCPKATGVLVALAADSDPAVARGAGAVLAWVRQNCVTSAPVTG